VEVGVVGVDGQDLAADVSGTYSVVHMPPIPPARAPPPPDTEKPPSGRWRRLSWPVLGGKRVLAGVGDPPGRVSCPVCDGARTPARDGVLDRWSAHGVDGGT
jgi:hypothetical protein